MVDRSRDSFERVFGPSYPWPDWDELQRQKASPDPHLAHEARTLERVIEVAMEWLQAHPHPFEWSPEKEAELRQVLASACPGCSERTHEAIRSYVTWYAWHEGMLRFRNRE
jgi:hypothetical protein